MRRALAVLVLLFAVVVAACDTNRNPASPSDDRATPTITSFTLSPASGPAGTSTRLDWVTAPSSVRVNILASAGSNPGTGFGAVSGTTTNPQVDTTYTIEVVNLVTGAKVYASQFFDVK